MLVTTGLRQVRPFGSVEWVDVRVTSALNRYSVICDPHKFTVAATNDDELLDRITKQLQACLRKAP